MAIAANILSDSLDCAKCCFGDNMYKYARALRIGQDGKSFLNKARLIDCHIFMLEFGSNCEDIDDCDVRKSIDAIKRFCPDCGNKETSIQSYVLAEDGQHIVSESGNKILEE